MLTSRCVSLTLALVMAAGAMAVPPVIDGKKTTTPTDDGYGAPKWVNTIPTNFGDSQPSPNAGNPEAVTTGVELVIPIASLGYAARPTSIRLTAFVMSGDGGNLSNQIIGSFPLNTGNRGFPGTTNFADINDPAMTGNQFITLSLPNTTSPPLTIDGRRVEPAPASNDPYPALPPPPNARIQANYTGYGDATHGQRGGTLGNGTLGNEGSEIDSISGRSDGTNLYLFITGNLEANGNKLIIAFDTGAVGQNIISGIPVATPASPYTNLNGMQFDAGFNPRYIVAVNAALADQTAQPGIVNLYVDYLSFDGTSAWTPVYCGLNAFPNTGTITNTTGALTGGDVGAPAIRAALDNSNIVGVVGAPVILTGDRDIATGSEIDAVYSKVEGGKLYLLITGNLKTDYTKLDLFFDTGPTAANPVNYGQNRLRGASQPQDINTGAPRYKGNVRIDFDGLDNMGANTLAFIDEMDPTQGRVPANGLKFESDFQATYGVFVTNGGSGPVSTYSNAFTLRPNGRREGSGGVPLDYGSYDGGAKPSNDPMNWDGPLAMTQDGTINDLNANYGPRLLADTLSGGVPNPAGLAGLLNIAIDNSNTAGVTATTADPVAAAAVTTGVELAIDLAELGWESGPIKLAGFLNASGHTAISNQVIGGIPAGSPTTPGLGDPRTLDLSAVSGTQYVVVYQPAAACPSISAQSGNETITCNGTANFSVTLADAGGSTYQWRRNGTPLTNGPLVIASGATVTISGATSANLSIAGVRNGNNGDSYDCVITTNSGSCSPTINSDVRTLTVTPVCKCNAADVAGLGGVPGADGQLTADDIVYFLAQFFIPNPAVCDIVGLGGFPNPPEGNVTVDDLVYFLDQFFRPCVP